MIQEFGQKKALTLVPGNGSFDNTAGIAAGISVGNWDSRHALAPVKQRVSKRPAVVKPHAVSAAAHGSKKSSRAGAGFSTVPIVYQK